MQTRSFYAAALLLGAASIAPARADLLIGGSGTIPYRIERYTDNGTDVGTFTSINTEEIAAIAVGSNGNVYTENNTLGYGTFIGFDPAGNVFASNLLNETVQEPASVTIGGNGNVLTTSTNFMNGLAGVLEFNAATGAFVKNVIPNTPAFSSAQFNPVGQKLYLSSNAGTTQYDFHVADTYTLHTTFPTLPSGQVRFAPGSSTVFLSPSSATEIDRYDSAGNSLGAFVAPGSGGLTTIQDYTFGGGYLFVLSGPRVGADALMRFDATTGAYIDTPVAALPTVFPHISLAYVSAPEPATGALVLLSLAGACVARRRLR